MVNLFRNYELRTAFAPPEKRRLPTTLVTGWLGSGKTTVVRHVLANRQDLRVACAVNDFAELNIDAELVAREETGVNERSRGVVELTNDCLCCTLGGELETEVWRMLDTAQQREGEGLGAVDYLLIETSGVVDPTETVAALDRKFGKLARVRLDSVVCVVDAESASASVSEGSGFGVGDEDGLLGLGIGGGAQQAWARQLSAADVVLLNKVDLLEGNGAAMAAARAFVAKWAPEAKVVECVRGQVPLPSILDVELLPQPEGKFGHDWDSAARPFLLSPTGGGLRKRNTSEARVGPFIVDPTKRVAHRAAAAAAAGAGPDLTSVSFEGGALSLGAFQRWAGSGIPAGVTRAKGFVTFAEDPGTRYDFHLSGRRRIEIEPSSGVSRGAPPSTRRKTAFDTSTASPPASTRLVLIGQGVDPAASLTDLQAMTSGDGGAPGTSAPQLAGARKAIASDPRLELIEADDTWCTPAAVANCFHFRLTGAASNGFTVNEMERNHGVDMNRMNAELVRALNAGGNGVVVTAAKHRGMQTYFGSDALVIRVAVARGGDDGMFTANWWSVVQEACTKVLQRHIAHIPKCRCGF